MSLQNSSKRKSAFAKSGVSSKRIKHSLRKPICQCACKVPLKVLLRLCMAFWSLLKPTQDRLLWCIQHESGNQRKKQWFLQGLLFKELLFGCFLSPFQLSENWPSWQDIPFAGRHGLTSLGLGRAVFHDANVHSRARIYDWFLVGEDSRLE